MFLRRILPAAALAAALSPVALSPASAAARVGTLDCRVGAGSGMLIVSSKPVNCLYRGINGIQEEYVGTVNKVGVDVGFTFKGRIVWAVFEASGSRRPALAGRYSGASVEATALIGVGANVLLGGGNGTITLQPISIQGQAGINVAGGIGSLFIDRVVDPVGYAAPAPYYKGHRYHGRKHARRHWHKRYKHHRRY